MKIIKTIDDWKQVKGSLSRPYALVPTMGCLHDGHISLIRSGRTNSNTLIVSIFVNPSQFGPDEDFKSYPRDLDADLSRLKREEVDIVFVPAIEEIYPLGFDTFVDPGRIAHSLEGEYRSNHFRGVATVVSKLFAIIQPNQSYFGQKDFQQSLVIKQISKDLNFNVDIVIEPTVRESDGLALSSRNKYLEKSQRQAAPIIFKALKAAKRLYDRGTSNAAVLRREMMSIITSEPLVQIDYIAICDAATLTELEEVNCPAVGVIAVRIGETRLLDNIRFH